MVDVQTKSSFHFRSSFAASLSEIRTCGSVGRPGASLASYSSHRTDISGGRENSWLLYSYSVRDTFQGLLAAEWTWPLTSWPWISPRRGARFKSRWRATGGPQSVSRQRHEQHIRTFAASARRRSGPHLGSWVQIFTIRTRFFLKIYFHVYFFWEVFSGNGLVSLSPTGDLLRDFFE